jgi:hypothetical protein
MDLAKFLKPADSHLADADPAADDAASDLESDAAEAVEDTTPEPPCAVTVDAKFDADFDAIHNTDAHVATCEHCGLSSSARTSDEKARRELAQLCAERLASEADGED